MEADRARLDERHGQGSYDGGSTLGADMGWLSDWLMRRHRRVEREQAQTEQEIREAQLRLKALETQIALVEWKRRGSGWKPHSSR